MAIRFTQNALKELERLPRDAQTRIMQALGRYDASGNPLKFAKPLRGGKFGDYRFRIGDYRALCDFRDGTILVLSVGDRKDIYR